MFGYIVILLFTLSVINCDKVVYPCKTPNDEGANCVSLFSCPSLMKSLGSLDPTAVDFVRNSICLGCEAGDFMVCCGTLSNYLHAIGQNQSTPSRATPAPSKPVASVPVPANTTPIPTPPPGSKEARREYVKKKLLPSRKFCGFQHTDDRFYNETETALDEFPWLVHVKFTDLEYEEEYGDRCHGVIISHQYVLTDAYCGYESKVIKLGQYSTATNVSCIDNPQFEECTEPTLYYKIEEKIRSGKRENGAYDFTLLRLAEKIYYTDFVRPICLPVDGSLRPASDPKLTFSGWGASGPGEIKKKRLHYKVTDEKACYDVADWLEGQIKFANVSLACLTPEENNTGLACNGEHGGPLMYKRRNQWFIDGIIIEAFALDGGTYSANFNSCSNKDPVTGIFITPDFMNWILDNIKD